MDIPAMARFSCKGSRFSRPRENLRGSQSCLRNLDRKNRYILQAYFSEIPRTVGRTTLIIVRQPWFGCRPEKIRDAFVLAFRLRSNVLAKKESAGGISRT